MATAGLDVCVTSCCHTHLTLVLCEYSKFRIESNSYFSIRFDSKRAQLFQIFEYLPPAISYLFNRMMSIFHLSNHASNQQNVCVQCCCYQWSRSCISLKSLYWPIMAHQVLKLQTIETTTVQCHKNSWIYLTSTYYWWLLIPTITIPFEMKKHYLHSTTRLWSWVLVADGLTFTSLHLHSKQTYHSWLVEAISPASSSSCVCIHNVWCKSVRYMLVDQKGPGLSFKNLE